MMRRAQASMEYLTTYGWAMLALLVALGALAYLGLLDVNRYLPQQCDTGAQLLCTDYALHDADVFPNNGYLQLQFQNGFREAINITGVWIVPNTPAGVQLLPDLSALPTEGVRVPSGEAILLQVNIPVGAPILLIEGERTNVPVRVTFRRDTTGSVDHNVTGVVFATVQ